MTLQGERGWQRKGAIMWRMNALDVGERRRLRQREAKRILKKRKKREISLCSWTVEADREVE